MDEFTVDTCITITVALWREKAACDSMQNRFSKNSGNKLTLNINPSFFFFEVLVNSVYPMYCAAYRVKKNVMMNDF